MGRLEGISLYAVAALAGGIAGLGDILLAKAVEAKLDLLWLLFGIFAWNVALLLFVLVLRSRSLPVAASLFLAANGVIVVAGSRVALGTNLTAGTLLGVALVLVGVVLLEVAP